MQLKLTVLSLLCLDLQVLNNFNNEDDSKQLQHHNY
jgi:hypothetical protein